MFAAKIYQPVDKLESCAALPRTQLAPKKLSGKQSNMRPQTSALLAAAAAAAAWLLYKKKKKRRVVITGCCGNLGRKLGAYLQERGVEVVGIEHPDYCAKGSEPPCDRVVQGDAQDARRRAVAPRPRGRRRRGPL